MYLCLLGTYLELPEAYKGCGGEYLTYICFLHDFTLRYQKKALYVRSIEGNWRSVQDCLIDPIQIQLEWRA